MPYGSPLQSIPNVGPATERDLRLLGITEIAQLKGRDPYALYDKLCARTKQRHDPCVMDVFIAAVRFAETGKAKPWWHYTAERKRHLARKG